MQEEKKIVKLEQEVTYTCECPNCGEEVYPNNEAVTEAVEYNVQIVCPECDTEFLITI